MKTKQIKQLKDGLVILIWNSVGEAAREGGFNPSLIRGVCLGDRQTHGGFSWEYVNEQDLDAQIGIKKPIICVYKNGKRRRFSSKREAAASLGISILSILNILLKRKKLNIQFKLSYENG